MKNKSILTYLILPVALLGWMWISRTPPSAIQASSLEAPQESFLAPDFKLASLDNDEFQLSEHRGQPIILNFWASWCPPCRAEMPDFQEAWLEYGDTDLLIVAVNATNQDSINDILNFVAEKNLDLPILLDTNGSITSSYQVHSLPTTFFINRSGVITKIIIGGPIPLSLLRVQAEQLLQD